MKLMKKTRTVAFVGWTCILSFYCQRPRHDPSCYSGWHKVFGPPKLFSVTIFLYNNKQTRLLGLVVIGNAYSGSIYLWLVFKLRVSVTCQLAHSRFLQTSQPTAQPAGVPSWQRLPLPPTAISTHALHTWQRWSPVYVPSVTLPR